MPLREDSYGSVEDVRALTRHLLDGASNFSTTTRPTLADVEAIINRWSAILNVALAAHDVTVPVSNEMAALACDQWVIRQAAAEVELTQRGTGFNGDEGTRLQGLRLDDAMTMAQSIAKALEALGAETGTAHQGLTFTGLDAQSERADSDNEAYEQPLFTRRQFDV